MMMRRMFQNYLYLTCSIVCYVTMIVGASRLYKPDLFLVQSGCHAGIITIFLILHKTDPPAPVTWPPWPGHCQSQDFSLSMSNHYGRQIFVVNTETSEIFSEMKRLKWWLWLIKLVCYKTRCMIEEFLFEESYKRLSLIIWFKHIGSNVAYKQYLNTFALYIMCVKIWQDKSHEEQSEVKVLRNSSVTRTEQSDLSSL